MDDLISRQAAIDKLKSIITDREYTSSTDEAKERIAREFFADIPSSDSVEVVRCKDCKYWVKDGNESFGYAMFCEHDCSLGGQGIKKPDDYCSYGERAEE